jgi:predicted MFS family arabinose efflux permease
MGNDLSTDTSKGWIISFFVTVFAMMTLQMSSMGFSPLLPAMREELGMTYSQQGDFAGMYGLFAIIMSIPGGILAKRFGEKNVLATGMLVVAMGLILLSQSSNTAMAFGSRGLWLVGYRPAFVCVMTAIALTAPPSFRSRSMGVIGAMSALGNVIGALFGSQIASSFGWRNGFVAYSSTILFGLLIFWFFYRGGSRTTWLSNDKAKNEAAKKKYDKPKSNSSFRNPIVWTLSVLVGMSGAGQFSSNFFIPSAAIGVFHMEANTTAYIISTGFGLGIFTNLFFGYLMDRFTKWNVMASIMIILIPAALGLNSTHAAVFWIAATLVLALGLTAAQQGYAIAGSIATGSETSNAMGMVAVGTGVFGYFGPKMLGLLRDLTGDFNAGWYLITALHTLALLFILFLKYYRQSGKVTVKTASSPM